MKFKISRDQRSIQQSLPEEEGNDDRRDISVLMGAVRILVLTGVFVVLDLTLRFGAAQEVFGFGLLFVLALRIASSVSRRYKQQLARGSALNAACTASIFLYFATTPGVADRIGGGIGGCWFGFVFFFFMSGFYMWKDDESGISPLWSTWHKEKKSTPGSSSE